MGKLLNCECLQLMEFMLLVLLGLVPSGLGKHFTQIITFLNQNEAKASISSLSITDQDKLS